MIDWTWDAPGRIENLRKWWDSGLSASQIATEMVGLCKPGEIGPTRNGILSKVHRSKFPARREATVSGRMIDTRIVVRTAASRAPKPASPVRTHDFDKPKAERIAATTKPPEMVVDNDPRPTRDEAFAFTGLGIKLVQLEQQTCHWPLGDERTEEFEYCGKPCKRRPSLIIGDPAYEPYCVHHFGLAYQPRGARESRHRQAEQAALPHPRPARAAI